MAQIKLTGRKRYRVGWRKKLILQVEVFEKGVLISHDPYYTDERPYEITYWRDAKVEDLTPTFKIGEENVELAP